MYGDFAGAQGTVHSKEIYVQWNLPYDHLVYITATFSALVIFFNI